MIRLLFQVEEGGLMRVQLCVFTVFLSSSLLAFSQSTDSGVILESSYPNYQANGASTIVPTINNGTPNVGFTLNHIYLSPSFSAGTQSIQVGHVDVAICSSAPLGSGNVPCFNINRIPSTSFGIATALLPAQIPGSLQEVWLNILNANPSALGQTPPHAEIGGARSFSVIFPIKTNSGQCGCQLVWDSELVRIYFLLTGAQTQH
ncbi:MAG: hypothetical protein ABSC48_08635 [Terracidiphilus sp.]|jgi:hypothetical protein